MTYQCLRVLLRKNLIGGAKSGKTPGCMQAKEIARLEFPGYIVKLIHRVHVIPVGEEVMLGEIESEQRIGIQDQGVLVANDVRGGNLDDLLRNPSVWKFTGIAGNRRDFLRG